MNFNVYIHCFFGYPLLDEIDLHYCIIVYFVNSLVLILDEGIDSII